MKPSPELQEAISEAAAAESDMLSRWESANVAATETLLAMLDRTAPGEAGSDSARRPASARLASETNGDELAADVESVLGVLVEAIVGAQRSEVAELQAYLGDRLCDDAATLEFGLLDPMGLAHDEVRNTAMLAFLLRPTEAHGLEDTVLCSLLALLRLRGEASPAWLDSLLTDDTRHAQVRTEFPFAGGERRGDLCVLVGAGSILLEAKINHVESPGQLAAYERMREAQQHRNAVLAFLTKDAALPRTAHTDEWICLGWYDVAAVVGHACEGRTGHAVQIARSWASSILCDMLDAVPLPFAGECVKPARLAPLTRYLATRKELADG